MANITLIHEEESAILSLATELESQGHDVRIYFDGVTGIAALQTDRPDLAIIGTDAPDFDSLEALSLLRKLSDVPVIILSSRKDENAEMMSFDLGADDYVREPIGQRLLIERVKAMLRRARRRGTRTPSLSRHMDSEAVKEGVIKHGRLTLVPASHECLWDKMPIGLTVIEYELLKHLVKKLGIVHTRENLVEAVYGLRFYCDGRTIDCHIKRLRAKFRLLDPTFCAIETVIGVGYSFR